VGGGGYGRPRLAGGYCRVVSAQGLVLRGVAITMDPRRPEVEAVGIRGGLIEAVGSAEEVRATAGEGAEVVELDGAVLPAFIDAHHHYSLAAFDAGTPDLHLPPGSSIADVLGLVEQAVGGGDGWLRLQGYDPAKLREGRGPRVDELDEVCPDRPLLLIAFSFHDGCLNSRGLAEMGWGRGSADPPNGRLLRRRRGRLTGEVSEGAFFLAEARSRDSLLARGEDAWMAECEAHGRALLACGIVRVGDAAVAPAFERLYQRAAADGRLPVIVHRMPVAAATVLEPRFDGEPTGAGGPATPVGPAKLFMDGAERCALCFSMSQLARSAVATLGRAVGGEGLAGLRAGSRVRWKRGRDGLLHSGMLFWDQPALDAAVNRAAERGLQVAQHAIGNEAIARAVTALEHNGHALEGLPGRPRLEHAMLLDDTLARRIADAGAIAVVQPYFIYDFAGDVAALTPPPEPVRTKPLRTLLDCQVTLAGSSDYPVSHYDVLAAIQAAVTRRTRHNRVCEPEEALTVEEALRAYTSGAAQALGVDHEAGTLEPGKRADIVVLSDNPLHVAPDALTEVRVERTYIGGRLAYEHS
jgi:predicted amidohydrolase YtcJ